MAKTTKKTAAKKATSKNKTAAKSASVTSMRTIGASGKPDMFKAMERTIKEMTMNPTNNKKFEQFSQEMANTSREGAEAFIKSGTILTKGMEDLFRTSISMAQSAAERQAQLVKEAMSAKTLNDFAAFQSKYAQANFEEFMAGATKISELSAKVLGEACEPLNAQMTKSMKKASQSMAA